MITFGLALFAERLRIWITRLRILRVAFGEIKKGETTSTPPSLVETSPLFSRNSSIIDSGEWAKSNAPGFCSHPSRQSKTTSLNTRGLLGLYSASDWRILIAWSGNGLSARESERPSRHSISQQSCR